MCDRYCSRHVLRTTLAAIFLTIKKHICVSLKFRDSLELHFVYWSPPPVRITCVQLNRKLFGRFEMISTPRLQTGNKCLHEISKILKVRIMSKNLKVRLYRSYFHHSTSSNVWMWNVNTIKLWTNYPFYFWEKNIKKFRVWSTM